MIDPLALACPYCRFTTRQGIAANYAQQQHQQWAAHANYVQSAAATARMKSTATQTLVFGILGILLFCTPLGIVGIVQGFRARAMAREARAPVPGSATAGLVLAIVSLFTSVGGLILIDRDVQEDKSAAEQRAAAIDKRLGARATAKTLDRDTACGIAEAHLYREGAEGVLNYNVKDVECVGRLTTSGEDRAEIDLVRFKDATRKLETKACLTRGGKWFVQKTVAPSSSCP